MAAAPPGCGRTGVPDRLGDKIAKIGESGRDAAPNAGDTGRTRGEARAAVSILAGQVTTSQVVPATNARGQAGGPQLWT
jgi:hypothetical protein